MFEMKTRNGLV